MKKIYRKRLNNKGFTLIELLAVVVILAVVMGIAMNSVLTSMNKSRGGSLADTAMIIANAFNQKYTESLVGGVPSNVYGDVLDTTDVAGAKVEGGYNFQSDATYYLKKGLANTFNISDKNYALIDDTSSTDVDTATSVNSSFVNFNVSTGRFIVCMFANTSGSYFVDNYKVVKVSGSVPAIATLDTITPEEGTMYACSDGSKSWSN